MTYHIFRLLGNINDKSKLDSPTGKSDVDGDSRHVKTLQLIRTTYTIIVEAIIHTSTD
jgi:hypothetical protein